MPLTLNDALQSAVQHHQAGRLDEAEALYRKILASEKDYPDALNLLGVLLGQRGKFADAEALLQRAVKRRPNEPTFRINLGNLYRDSGQLDKALFAARKAIELRPSLADAHALLAMILHVQGDLDGAVAAYQQALGLCPDFFAALCKLGGLHKTRGELDDALRLFREARRVNPADAGNHDTLAVTMLYHPDVTETDIRAELRRYNDDHAAPLRAAIQPLRPDLSPGRRLRIGYVSADLRDHVVAYNLLPLLENHDHAAFEIFCYSNSDHADDITARFRAAADAWRPIATLPDDQAADMIRADRIDILVDLSLHTFGNRLQLFARKPAPIQVTFAGYPGSTGLDTIDYRLTDPYLDPPTPLDPAARPPNSLGDAAYSEKSHRLPHTFWCYHPVFPDVQVSPLPFLSTGVVTFACLNNFCKINDKCLRTWAAILRQVPESRLALLTHPGSHRDRVLALMASESIDRDRIEFLAPQPRRAYMELFRHVDISLDPWPYNGHTSGLDSLWMGVPVVTLVGSTVVGRGGLSQLTNLGLLELITFSPDDYVTRAVELAADPENLAQLRTSLRPRMEASPLMNGPQFARDIEAAYRHLWQQSLAQPPSP